MCGIQDEAVHTANRRGARQPSRANLDELAWSWRQARQSLAAGRSAPDAGEHTRTLLARRWCLWPQYHALDTGSNRQPWQGATIMG